MKIKLTRSQFDAVFLIVDVHLKGMVESNKRGFANVILATLLESVYVKFYRANAIRKKKYTIPLTGAEACALHIYFSKKEGHDIYLSTILTTILTDIHKEYS